MYGHRMRLAVASDVAYAAGVDYETTLATLEAKGCFDNWTLEDCYSRPVNIDDLADMVAYENEAF